MRSRMLSARLFVLSLLFRLLTSLRVQRVVQHQSQHQLTQTQLYTRHFTGRFSSGRTTEDLIDYGNNSNSTAFVLLGGYGNLAQKKIIPALLRLFQQDRLPAAFHLVGCSRTLLSHDQYRAFIAAAAPKDIDPTSLERFLRLAYFHSVRSYSNADDMSELQPFLSSFSRVIAYFALPPHQFESALDAIEGSGLARDIELDLVIEKPVGRDLASCERILDKVMASTMPQQQKQQQVEEARVRLGWRRGFLVDHFPGKTVLANILTLRFANSVLEPLLSAALVSRVELHFKERNLLEGRSGYFESYGILRDIVQNHLLQAAALLLMERPADLSSPAAISAAKAAFLESIVPVPSSDVVLGQYEGYRAEQGVACKSTTSTYAACVLYSESARWRGVPILFTAGKALDENTAYIQVFFKPGELNADASTTNVLTLRIQPSPGYSLTTLVNRQGEGRGQGDGLSAVQMDYTYDSTALPDAYEGVVGGLFGGGAGRGVFVSPPEVLASWRIFDAALPELDATAPARYTIGGKGPLADLDRLRARHSMPPLYFGTQNVLVNETRRIEEEHWRSREFALKQGKLLDARVFYAAARIQGILRGYLARLVFRHLLLEKTSAMRIQRTIRGWLGRMRWKHEYWKSVSVVKSKRALQEMLLRSKLVREVVKKKSFGVPGYRWKELFDPLTCAFWYYNVKTGENSWDAPLPMQFKLVCPWEGFAEYGGLPSQPRCRCLFSNLQAYYNHLTSEHRWYCVACEHRNTGVSFPFCALCGNSHGAGEGGLYSAAQALRRSVDAMRRDLSGFMQRDGATQKDFIKGYSLKARLSELAMSNRGKELERAREEETGVVAGGGGGGRSEWDLLLSIRFDEDADADLPTSVPETRLSMHYFVDLAMSSLGSASVASSSVSTLPALVRAGQSVRGGQLAKHTSAPRLVTSAKRKVPFLGTVQALAELSPLETLMAVPSSDIARGKIPAPAFDAIVKGESAEVARVERAEEFAESEYEHVILPNAGIFVCSAFTRGLCTSSACPLAHPGVRDNAKIEHYTPIMPGLRKRPYVCVCQEAITGQCSRPPLSCEKYHVYIRPDTLTLIRRIYPLQMGQRTKVFPSGVVRFSGRATLQGFNGYGVMTWRDQAAYMGEWVASRRHGVGIYRTSAGYEHVGFWAEGKKSGLGFSRQANGSETYEGEFSEGRMQGVGRWDCQDQSYYEGEFVNNKFEGLGVLCKKSGDRFVGRWAAGELDGLGTYALRSGEGYKGFFSRGRRHGRGVCRFANGAKYYGDWYCDLPSGKGVLLAPTEARLKFRDTCNADGIFGKYVGDFESGFLQGEGTYHFPNGDTYQGQWRRNKACGVGTYSHANGNVYAGEWSENQRCGRGTYTFVNGSTYAGFFESNFINGRGIFRYATGACYRGNFLNAKKHGRGIHRWPNGNEYRGDFVSNQMEGVGELVYQSGCRYKGSWQRNQKHGRGEMVYMNRDVYVGEFREDLRQGRGLMRFSPDTPIEERYDGDWLLDEMHGHGVYTYTANDGLVYEGAFVKGKREGKGRLSFKDGSYYEGDFSNEQMDGLGVYVSADGYQYEGEWSQNFRHGTGTQIYPDKTIYHGQFYMNKRQGFGTTYYRDGRSSHYGEWAEDVMVGPAQGTHTLSCGAGVRGGPSEIHVKVYGF